jgi:L,D-transpeptidase YcbB
MRNLLLATSTVALALMFSSEAYPGSQIQADSKTAPQVAESELNSPGDAPSASTVAQETEPPTPIQSAEDAAVGEQLRDLLENKLQKYVPRQQDRAGVEAFYRKRGFAPLWVSDGKSLPGAQQTVDFLHGAAADGLDPDDYPTPRFADANPARLAADELALTNSVAVFVRHASTGRVAFTRVSGAIHFDLRAPDPEQFLETIASSSDVSAALDSFNPRQPEYKALKAELAIARRSQDAEAAKAALNGKSTTPQHKDRREPKSEAARADTIIANMERWRWLPHELGAAYVMVNVPDYTLKVVNLGRTVWSTRIVVGKPGEYATPLLAETMKYITLNPTWNVPPSIIRNEYLPVLERDPNALSRLGLKIEHDRDGSIHILQPPGERNALGRIRFNFPNRFLVYQHDTPNKSLCEKPARAFSHGCMRVQHPDQYAEVVLGLSQPEDGYTAQLIRSLYGTDERNINLKNQIPVYITYQTAFVNDAMKLQMRPDIYGLDQAITNLLNGASEVADSPIFRHTVANKPVKMHVSRPVLAHVLPAARKTKLPNQPFGWEARWDANYFQSRRSAYESFSGFRSW